MTFANEHAFEAFHDTTVFVDGLRDGRPVKQVVCACVFEGDVMDAITDASSPTEGERWAILVPVRGWFDARPPDVEDAVRFHYEGREIKCKVTRVSRSVSEFHISARSK